MSAAFPTPEEISEHLTANYGRCVSARCECPLDERWVCMNWRPCGATTWDELRAAMLRKG